MELHHTEIEVIQGGGFLVVGGDEPPNTWFWRDSVAISTSGPGRYKVAWNEEQVSVERL